MPKKLRITFYLFFIIVFLPTFIFSLFEMGSFSHYEEKLEKVLEKSLHTALYSVNQFTSEVINDWTSNISVNLSDKKPNKEELKTFFDQTPSIKYFFKIENGEITYTNTDTVMGRKEFILNFIDNNQPSINRLKDYLLNSNYHKPEAFSLHKDNEVLILFLCKSENAISTCGFILNTTVFINEVLMPKTQEIAEQDFNYYIFDSTNTNILYSTNNYEDNDTNNISIREKFWLLPGYTSGISLKSNTINDIVRPRTQKFLYLSIGVTLALIFGVYMLFKSMRHQIELAQLKSEFISNVSHEIRTPLALIQMYIETLDMDRVKKEEKKKEYYNIILNETIRLSGIVNKILNFTRIEKGKREYQFSDTSVNSIIENIMSTYQFHLKNRGFEYKIELTPDLPIIFADKEAITDSVINLIDNAVKYSGENKKIILETGRLGDKVQISVKDFGIGISDKDQKNIFDKFFRVTHGDLAHKAKGTGLGLTIVKHVIDAHHGNILLESKKGEGSKFTLAFPPEGAMS